MWAWGNGGWSLPQTLDSLSLCGVWIDLCGGDNLAKSESDTCRFWLIIIYHFPYETQTSPFNRFQVYQIGVFNLKKLPQFISLEYIRSWIQNRPDYMHSTGHWTRIFSLNGQFRRWQIVPIAYLQSFRDNFDIVNFSDNNLILSINYANKLHRSNDSCATTAAVQPSKLPNLHKRRRLSLLIIYFGSSSITRLGPIICSGKIYRALRQNN